ncbi:MAG: WbqC family protein [Bacteroidetes bacterium]|nr:WbqC family protein [Bacteroidota bacterium]MBU1578716.1 WbqC family protein [Bacteroidota bacterium]MBU2558033.1 WbqC family protein [Bacteroidota bacterium]
MHDSQFPFFSTAYFPPISYISQCLKHTGFCIEAYETFPKQSYRNRCIIATANGLQNLIIPIKKPYGNRTPTHEVTISYAEPWQRLHQRALHTAYKASPFYDFYIHELLAVFESKHDNLLNLNREALKIIFKLLKVDPKFYFSEAYLPESNVAIDFRNFFNPKKQLKANLFPFYYQVFGHKYDFQANLSILDLLFNEGPQSLLYLKQIPDFSQGRQS